MTFVIDASVTLAWCFDDEGTASGGAGRALERLEHDDALAPSIWPLEVANGLRTAERRGRLAPADVARIRELLSALPITVEATVLAEALGDVLDLARRLELTAYDAAYLSLAAARGIPLATADDRLRRACEQAGVPLVG